MWTAFFSFDLAVRVVGLKVAVTRMLVMTVGQRSSTPPYLVGHSLNTLVGLVSTSRGSHWTGWY